MLKTLAIGHLGKDAIVNQVNGKTVINFSVAHTENFKDASGQKINRTTWVECSYWSDRTAIAQYLTKGSQVYVEGNPLVSTYTNNQNQVIPVLRLRVDKIQLLGSKDAGQQPAQPQTQQQQSPASLANEDVADDLPF